jgi:DNA-binding transcriptional regulator YiaG
MALPNRVSYDRAAAMISSGKWRVDAEAGLVWSARTKRPLGQKIKGRYHSLMLKHPDRIGAVQVSLHRVIWEFVHGPISDDLEINHLDGNRSNNAISNLELATDAANTQHAIKLGLRPACVMAKDGAANHMARLTESDIREIRRLLTRGLSQNTIATRFGVSQTNISHIKLGRSWAHVA